MGIPIEKGTWNHVKRESYLEQQQQQQLNWGYKDNSRLQRDYSWSVVNKDQRIFGGFSWDKKM